MHRGKLLAGRLAALLVEEKQIRDQGRRDRFVRSLSRPRKRVEIIQHWEKKKQKGVEKREGGIERGRKGWRAEVPNATIQEFVLESTNPEESKNTIQK